MADLETQPGWPAARQLGRDEFASGGPNGNLNEHAKVFLARTEYLKKNSVIKVSSVKDIQSAFTFGAGVIQTTSFHTDTNIGGNTYIYVALPKKLHNGATIIDPLKSFPGNWSDLNKQQEWFSSSDSITGDGIYLLVKSIHDLNVSDFGVHPGIDSSYALQAAIDYSRNKAPIKIDTILNTSRQIIVRSNSGLIGSNYVHNSKSTLECNIINYSGSGDAIKLEGPVNGQTPRNITLKNFQINDVLNTAKRAIVGSNAIGCDIDVSTYGFESSVAIQQMCYYTKLKTMSYEYRLYGVEIGGNVNNAEIDLTLVSSLTTTLRGFRCGFNNPDNEVVASASNNPKVKISCEQAAGRPFDINQVRAGEWHLYMEMPGEIVNYENISCNISRCYGTTFYVYMSGKTAYNLYFSNSRDCTVKGESKGATTSDIHATDTCVGIEVAGLHAGLSTVANHSTGRILGRSSTGSVIRESVGVASSLPTCGGYGVSSKLYYTNPQNLPDLTIITSVDFDAKTKVTTTLKRKEIGKIVTTAGSFGVLGDVKVTGLINSNIVSVSVGANLVLVGDYIQIAGITGARRITRIYQDGSTTMLRLDSTLNATVTDASVSYFAPILESMILMVA